MLNHSKVAAPDPDAIEVVALGTLPPPVTGMTLLTEQVVRGLQAGGPLRLLNWSTGLSKKGLKFRIARLLRVMRSYFTLLRRGRASGAKLYLVANSSAGLFLTALFVGLARRLGYQVYLHHHVYFYIDQHDWRMGWIDRRMGSTGVHVVHCEKMMTDFRRRYDSVCQFEFILPSVVSSPIGRPRELSTGPFRLGHLSNLTLAKGLDLVVDTFERILNSGHDLRLDLAGPIRRGRARRLLDRTLSNHPDRVRYHGPLYGDSKVEFFAHIDAFVFPSRSESWGIVLHEAMCAGVPVIAYDRGCAEVVLGDQGGLLIQANANFVELAAAQVVHWIANPQAYHQVSQKAIEQAELLNREGPRTMAEFVAHVYSKAAGPKI